MSPLSTPVLVQAVDALAAVLALLTEWGAHEGEGYKVERMREGRDAVVSRDENAVRVSLAELACVLDELADSKDDERTFFTIAACHSAIVAIQRDLVRNAKGRMVA